MRLQLILILLLAPLFSFAQEEDTAWVKLEDVQLDFLMSYYEQDGNHSPVTGGIGTESLQNYAPAFKLLVPIDSLKKFSASGGVDLYSSASSDNINNPFLRADHVSSASANDHRMYLDMNWAKARNDKRTIWNYGTGISWEWDVQSLNIGGGVQRFTKDKNRSISLDLKYYHDWWRLVYPVELRSGSRHLLLDDQRKSLNIVLGATSIMSSKSVISFSSDLVIQNGLLSTPFHRVYFPGEAMPDIERLPNTRIKYPVSMRWNVVLNDNVYFKSFIRVYNDSWGLQSQTFKIELPLIVSGGVRLYPYYRYHTQTAVKYFAAYKEHQITDTYYTNDYDLSGFDSYMVGMGILISPVYGIAEFNSPIGKNYADRFKNFEVRYGYYSRSDGLTAHVVTTALRFKLSR